jgi:hypothetical protein
MNIWDGNNHLGIKINGNNMLIKVTGSAFILNKYSATSPIKQKRDILFLIQARSS